MRLQGALAPPILILVLTESRLRAHRENISEKKAYLVALLFDGVMHLTIRFPTGCTVEGVLLTGTTAELRVAVQGWDDVAVFRQAGGGWFAENGDRVAIHPHLPSSISEHQYFDMRERPRSRTRSSSGYLQ